MRFPKILAFIIGHPTFSGGGVATLTQDRDSSGVPILPNVPMISFLTGKHEVRCTMLVVLSLLNIVALFTMNTHVFAAL